MMLLIGLAMLLVSVLGLALVVVVVTAVPWHWFAIAYFAWSLVDRTVTRAASRSKQHLVLVARAGDARRS